MKVIKINWTISFVREKNLPYEKGNKICADM